MNRIAYAFFFLLLCVQGMAQMPEQDCIHAIPICTNNFVQTRSFLGQGTIQNEISSSSCMVSGELNDIWYSITIGNDGNLGFEIKPTALINFNWIVYNMTGKNCSELKPVVSCNYSNTKGNTGPNGIGINSTEPASGSPFNKLIPAKAGEVYLINISNAESTIDGYTIDFSSSDAAIFNTRLPGLLKIDEPVSCSGNLVILHFKGNILCSSLDTSDFKISSQNKAFKVSQIKSNDCSNGAVFTRSLKIYVNSLFQGDDSLKLSLSGEITDDCGNSQHSGSLSFVSEKPFTVIPKHVNTCLNSPGLIYTNVSGTDTPFLFRYNGDGGIAQSNMKSDTFYHSFSKSGVYYYTVTVTNKSGCSISKKDSIIIFPDAKAGFTYNKQGNFNFNFLNTSENGKSYLWDFGDGDISSLKSPSHTFLKEGTYQVKLFMMNQDDCPDSVFIVINTEDNPPPNPLSKDHIFLVPSIFYPNSNDGFHLLRNYNSGISDFNFSVYDRWGKKIYETQDYNFKWEGKSNTGEPLPEGIYVYFATGFFGDGKEMKQSGTIALFK